MDGSAKQKWQRKYVRPPKQIIRIAPSLNTVKKKHEKHTNKEYFDCITLKVHRKYIHENKKKKTLAKSLVFITTYDESVSTRQYFQIGRILHQLPWPPLYPLLKLEKERKKEMKIFHFQSVSKLNEDLRELHYWVSFVDDFFFAVTGTFRYRYFCFHFPHGFCTLMSIIDVGNFYFEFKLRLQRMRKNDI